MDFSNGADGAEHTVGQVARMSGVTVRTLHHYDDVGLLSPGGRSASGYRLYGEADLERLQHILSYRELGFPLEEIAEILADPAQDPTAQLRRQHELLTARIARLRTMADAVERALEARKMGIPLTPEERFEVFGDAPDHSAEAERRWGGTDAYRESARRTSAYTKEDWLRERAEAADWGERLAALMDSGAPADGPAAVALAVEHRDHITRWFYPCTPDIHRGLAALYTSDPRFTATYDTLRPGLAHYLHTAIHAASPPQG